MLRDVKGDVEFVGRIDRSMPYNGVHTKLPRRGWHRPGHGTGSEVPMQPERTARRYKQRATIPWQERFWRFVTSDGDGCWEWTGSRNADGYGRLNRGRAGEGIIKAHRASYELHHGPIPASTMVCHRCDNPPCVNPAYLFLGSMRDNLRDAARKGRTGPQRGGSASIRTIADEQVRELRMLAVAGAPYAELAARFGIARAYVSDLARGKARRAAGGPLSGYRQNKGTNRHA